MEWSTSVTDAVAQSKASQTPLLILVEPHGATSNPNLARIATNCLHKFLFTDPVVQRLMTATRLSPVRLIADPQNHDYTSFMHFFRHADLPDILLISSTGMVLWQQSGYISPRSFVGGVANACGVDTSGWFGERARSATLAVAAQRPAAGVSEKRSGPIHPSEHDRVKADAKPVILSAPKSGMTLPTQKKTKLQARLPGGENVTGSYPPQTPFRDVRAWLSDSAALPSARLLIATAFPRYVFDGADDGKTLAELDLVPSASLVVADISAQENTTTAGTPAVGVLTRGRNALASVYGLITSFVGSFFGPTVAEQRGDYGGDVGEDRGEGEGESERYPDEDNLRYNGNSTQFGYDDNDR